MICVYPEPAVTDNKCDGACEVCRRLAHLPKTGLEKLLAGERISLIPQENNREKRRFTCT